MYSIFYILYIVNKMYQNIYICHIYTCFEHLINVHIHLCLYKNLNHHQCISHNATLSFQKILEKKLCILQAGGNYSLVIRAPLFVDSLDTIPIFNPSKQQKS